MHTLIEFIIHVFNHGLQIYLHFYIIIMKHDIVCRLNELASQAEPFIFVINYNGTKAYIKRLSEIDSSECLYDFESMTNTTKQPNPKSSYKLTKWEVKMPMKKDYKKSFDIVKSNILKGNSYLVNLTCKVAVDCNLNFQDIFFRAKSKYKILLKESHYRQFVCFSPETFVKIKNGRIFSYPMKGTIDAHIPNAQNVLIGDEKEAAEHATIVDLIRNDLSKVAEQVIVERYRYVDTLHTNHGDILQTSSEVSGKLPTNYQTHIGDILAAILPAGSITGAPKDKTMQIIHEAEQYERGYYTGVMGIYNHGELNSAVMIRFLEQNETGTHYKAGGGITCKSDYKKEYDEVLQKIYLPI